MAHHLTTEDAKGLIQSIFLTWKEPYSIKDPEASAWTRLKFCLYGDGSIWIPNPDFPSLPEFRRAVEEGRIDKETLNYAAWKLIGGIGDWAEASRPRSDCQHHSSQDIDVLLEVFPRYRDLIDLREDAFQFDPRFSDEEVRELLDYVIQLADGW